jgi:formaldehyde-activating enzyme involved in methanogenesis
VRLTCPEQHRDPLNEHLGMNIECRKGEYMLFRSGRWKLVSIIGGAAVAVILAAVWLLAGTSVANASEVTAADVQFVAHSATGPGLLSEGYLGHGGWGRGGVFGGDINYQQLLADALGISIDDLQSAYETARTAAIEQAVEQGLITQEQADEMLVWGGFCGRGFGFFGFRHAPKDVAGGTIDEEALLANALNISVDELQAAREKANQAAIAQAVEEGIITQEQADEMQAQRNLQSYLNRDALLAKALGMTLDDLKAAYANGETLSTLMSQQGLDAATVRQNLQTAYKDALAQAVTDGVITQAQADELQNRPGFGFGMPFGPGGFGGFGGRMGPRGGFEHGRQQAPDTGDDTGIRFHRPGRGIEAGSAI